ncbi:MAG TPA: hypothetical protein VEL07_05780 [Planctomycetota bacterium]|nr:hypothetical protein [Planctomycetota bacterium]
MIASSMMLFGRTLLLETRGWRSASMRIALGVGVLLMLVLAHSTMGMRSAPGGSLLAILAWSAAIMLSLLGLSYFPSAITEEKEERMLGLLRMAGMAPIGIVLAKSTSRLWDTLLLLGVLMPFAMLAVTLGGVSVEQVLATLATLMCYAFVLANLGLLASVLMPTARAAGQVMLVAMSAVLIVPALIPPLAFLDEASVFTRIGAIAGIGYGGDIVSAWEVGALAIGAGAFVVAWAMFDRFAHDAQEGAAEGGGWVFRRRRGQGLRSPAVGARAIAWKDYHFALGGSLWAWLKPVLMAALVVSITVYAGGTREHVGSAMLALAPWWFALEVGLHLSRIYALEIRAQTLASLLTLPFPITAITATKLVAVARAMIPCGIFFAVGALLAPGTLGDFFGMFAQEPITIAFMAMPLCIMIYFWAWCAFLSVVMKRAAFVTAIGVLIGTYIASSIVIGLLGILMIAVGGMGGVAIMTILICGGLLAVSIVLCMQIPRRLEARAAQ